MNRAARIAKLHDREAARWRDAWANWSLAVDAAIPLEVQARIEEAPRPVDRSPAAQRDDDAFMDKHGLRELVDWLNAVPESPDPDTVNLRHWPWTAPMPPDEPSGVWEKLLERVEDPTDDGLRAAIGVWILAEARVARGMSRNRTA